MYYFIDGFFAGLIVAVIATYVTDRAKFGADHRKRRGGTAPNRALKK